MRARSTVAQCLAAVATGCVLALLALPALDAAPQDAAMLRVAAAIEAWDGANAGALFAAVKAANPGRPAIVSMRELNKAIADRTLPASVLQRSPAIIQKQKAAQRLVRERVLFVRTVSYDAYRLTNPTAFRSVYGNGDIGSWPTATDPDASMDIDWTVFGTDPDVTADLRDRCKADLLRDLVGSSSELTLADFDVVVTAEGHEAAAGVFETEGGIDWAKRNMKRVTIVHPDGRTRTYDLASSDPIAEMAQAEHMARFRDLASKGGDYNRLFDARGSLRAEIFDNENSNEAAALWAKYMALLSASGIDFYRSRSSTATGGCLDMAKHLQEEVITKKHAPAAKLKKTLKYVARADNISRGVDGMGTLIASDPLLGDPAYRDVVQLARTIGSASPEQVDAILRERFGEMPDAALQDLGDRARRTILRLSELSFQVEMDRIILDVPDRTARSAALDKLAADFRIVAGEGGSYAELANAAGEQIARVREANDAGTLELMREHYVSLQKIRRSPPADISKTEAFLKQTELGSRLLEKGGKLLKLGNTPVMEPGVGRYSSSAANVVIEVANSARTTGMPALQLLGSAAMWTEVLNSVATAKSDADLAVALGHTLVNNTFFGMVLQSAYAGIVMGDNDALGKAVMYMLVPETALPALVAALGTSAMNFGAQRLFDAQMDGAYSASVFKNGQITDFAGLGMPGDAGATYFVDAMADGRASEVAQDIVSRSTATETGSGANALAIVAVGAAIRGTVDNGSMLVFKEDGPLLKASDTIKRVTDDIADCAKAWGVEVALSAAAASDLPAGLDRAQTAAFVRLMGQREKARAEARAAMAAAMVRTFLERHSAETSLDSGTARREYDALVKIFADLGISKEGATALDAEGAPYNLITNWLTSTREKQITAVKAVHKFTDAYSTVLQARGRADAAVRANMGDDASISPRALTGSLPLTASPSIDVPLASSFLADIGGLGTSVSADLQRIKGAKLDGAFDADTAKKLYSIRFRIAECGMLMQAASDAQHLHWAIEIFDKQNLHAQHSAAAERSSGLRGEEAALLNAYRDHYTVAGTFAVGLEGPAEINAGQQTTLKAVVTLAGTRGTSSAVPADIARQFAYAWSSGPANLGKSSSATRSYRLDTPGTHTFTVKVTRHAMEAGRAVERTIGEKSWSIKVNKPGTPAATTAGAKPSAAGGTGAAAAARGAGAGASSAGGAAAAGAPAGSAAAPPSAASIPEVAFDPAFTAGTWSLQSATDETSPVDTGTKPCPDALRTEKNFYDDAKTKLRTEYTYYLDSGRTIRCGAEKRYYENGILQYEATRLHDAFEGRLTRYWGSGRTFDVTTFEDGTKSGLYVSYWSNGQLRSRGLFRMNRKYDAWSYFLQDGTLEAEGPYYRKFSTVVSNDVGCPIESNDPHHLNEGLYWQCGNRFGAWTFVRKGEKVTENAQKRGDVDDQVDRDYWDRMAGSATLKGLEAEFTSVNGRLNAAEGEVAARPSCTDCRQTVRTLTMQLEKIGERMGVERDRLYAESRAKFVKAGSDVEAPEPPKAAPTAGTVTLSSTGAATSLASATSSATWSEFPKSVAWGDKPAIRVAASGGGPALFTAIGVTGFSGDAVRASGAQAASWNGLANALFAQGVSKGATRTIQVKHRGPGGLATRSYVYEWTEAGAISATLTVPGAINGRIVLGQSSAVRAAVATASQKPAAAYVYQWQPNPEVTFGAVETSAPQSSAVFTRLGPVKLWVTILQATGGRLATVGESNQADVEVVPPSVKLGVSAEPRPGREVRVTTTMTPEVTDRYVDFWWEVKGNVLQAGAAGNARSFSFRPKDTMPVTVTVHGKVRDGGDEFAKEDIVITPLAYDVRVSAPRAMGPTPQEWRPGVGGLGDVQRPIVVFQNVSMRADIAPAPGNASLRYAWTVSSDACSISNPVSQEPTFSCSQPGTFDVAVVVRDDLGCVLGSGTGRLPIARSVNDPVPPSTRPPATGTPAATPARPPVASDKPTPTTAKPPTAPPATMPPATTPATTPPATPPATTPPAAPPATKPPAAPPATKPPAAPPATKPPAAPTTAPPTTAPTMAAGSAALVTEAQGLYDAGKYADAAKAFDAVIAADPSSAAAFAGRGLSRYGLGDRAGALADFEQALRVDPNHADAYRGRSMVRRAANDFTGALADAQRAVALAPNQYRAYLTRGLAKQKVTDNGGALFDFTKAIELKPDYAPSYAYRASVRLEVMDYDGALADYNRYLGMNPNDSSATNNRGVVKDRLGDIKGALADFERAAALDPANTNATRNIGLARAKLKGGGGAPSEA